MPSQKNILLVEGKDDLNVIAHLLRHHLAIEKVEDVINIQNRESISQLFEGLRNDLQRSDLEKLGIVVDADLSLEDRWTSLRDRLANLSDINIIDLPNTPIADGTIIVAQRQDREVKVGIWLMPDNEQAGILEDFVSFLIPSDDLLWERARHAVGEIPAEQRLFSANDERKAEIYTWLAWQAEPGRPLGLAIRAKFFDAQAPHAQRFVHWLRQLFEL